MSAVFLDTFWLVTPSGCLKQVHGCYNGRVWSIAGHGFHTLGVDLFLSKDHAMSAAKPLSARSGS